MGTGVYRGEGMKRARANDRAGGHTGVAWRGPKLLLAGLLALACPTWPQELPDQPETVQVRRKVSRAPRITGASTYMGILDLGAPLSVFNDFSGRTVRWLATSGGAADFSWSTPGEHGRVSLDYRIGYNAHPQAPSSNGFDQTASFLARSDPNRRFMVTVSASGRSVRTATLLFQAWPSSWMPTGGAGSSAAPVVDGLDLGGNMSLYGVGLKTLAAGAGFRFSQSRRLTWRADMRGNRVIPGSGGELGQQSRSVYPAATLAGLDAGLSYSLSRRTSLDAATQLFRSYSTLDRYQTAGGSFTITRQLGLNLFGRASAGYGALSDLRGGANTRHSYTGAAGLGTTVNGHTVSVLAQRSLGDQYGLGAGSTQGGRLDWGWTSRNQVWAATSGLGYSHLTGRNVSSLNLWSYNGRLSRRLTRQLSWMLEAGVASQPGQAVRSRANLGHRGMRVSLLWHP